MLDQNSPNAGIPMRSRGTQRKPRFLPGRVILSREEEETGPSCVAAVGISELREVTVVKREESMTV